MFKKLKSFLGLKIDVEELLNLMITTCSQPLFPISELIQKEYKESGKCPFCDKDAHGTYHYHPFYIGIFNKFLCIKTEDYTLVTMVINNCPICGKKLE